MMVHKIMRHPAVSISVSATLVDAASLMCKHDIGILPVTENDRVIGIITDRDIVIRWLARSKQAMAQQVREHMTSDVISCSVIQSVEEAAARMADNQVRRLPVLDVAGKLTGVLSIDDIAEDYSEHLAGETLGEIVEAR